jgi:hypothetical protein
MGERLLMRPLPSLRPALCRGALRKVNKTQTIRFGSARYSLPTGWVGKLVEVSVVDHEVGLAEDAREIDRHLLMAPGEVSIKDEHYQGRSRVPARAIRIRTGTERAFLALGPVADAFLRSAGALAPHAWPPSSPTSSPWSGAGVVSSCSRLWNERRSSAASRPRMSAAS